MTKTDLKKRLKNAGKNHTNRAIADLFGIKEQAVQQWPEERIPPLRFYELLQSHPKIVKGARA